MKTLVLILVLAFSVIAQAAEGQIKCVASYEHKMEVENKVIVNKAIGEGSLQNDVKYKVTIKDAKFSVNFFTNGSIYLAIHRDSVDAPITYSGHDTESVLKSGAKLVISTDEVLATMLSISCNQGL